MSGPFNPRWNQRPNPFAPQPLMPQPGASPFAGGALGGPQAPVFTPPPAPAFNPPAAPQVAPSMGMPGGNPTAPPAAPGGGGPGVGGYASAGLDMLQNKDRAGGDAMVKGAMTGATLGSVVPGVGTAVGAAAGAGLGLLTSILGGGKKHAPRPALLLPPRR